MTTAFLLLWAVYTLYSLARNLSGSKKGGLPAQLLQTILVLIALRYTWVSGALSRGLWSPPDIAAGIVLGHVAFAVSLMITHQHLGDVIRHALNLRGLAGFVRKTPEICVRYLGVAAVEELVYRAGAQEMLMGMPGGAPAAIGVTALCFCVLHHHFLKNGLVSAFEFVLFTLVIGVMYYYTASLALVILVHWVRNVESAYLDFCAVLEDTQDEEEALRVMSARHDLTILESP